MAGIGNATGIRTADRGLAADRRRSAVPSVARVGFAGMAGAGVAVAPKAAKAKGTRSDRWVVTLM